MRPSSWLHLTIETKSLPWQAGPMVHCQQCVCTAGDSTEGRTTMAVFGLTHVFEVSTGVFGAGDCSRQMSQAAGVLENLVLAMFQARLRSYVVFSPRLMNRFALYQTIKAGVDLITAAIAWIFDVGEAQLRRVAPGV